MEQTRIRYTKRGDGILISKEMLSKSGGVVAMIDSETVSFKIKKTEDNSVLGQGAAKNLAYVKKMIKSELKALGVQFLDEVREHKTEGEENGVESQEN